MPLLPYLPPYDFPAIHAFFAAHEIPNLEHLTSSPTLTYSRLFQLNTTPAILTLTQHPTKPALHLRLTPSVPSALPEVTRRLRRMFDLDADPALVAAAFEPLPLFHALRQKHPGLRLPRGFDPFETAICAILGQLVSLAYARTLAGQLVQHYGIPVTHPLTHHPARLFPTPHILATTPLPLLKTTTARKQAIRTLSQHILENKLSLDTPDPHSLRKSLLAIPGIGPWTAEYIALRCTPDTDAFPATDLILKRALSLHPTLNLHALKPYRSYAALHLWKEYAKSLSRTRSVSEAPLNTPHPGTPPAQAAQKPPPKKHQ